MVLRLQMYRSVSIENAKLSLVYCLLMLAIVCCCMYSWIAQKGGTVLMLTSAQLSQKMDGVSLRAAKLYQPHQDPWCSRLPKRGRKGTSLLWLTAVCAYWH